MKDWDDDRLLQAYLDRTLSSGETFQVEQRFCQEPEFAERLFNLPATTQYSKNGPQTRSWIVEHS